MNDPARTLHNISDQGKSGLHLIPKRLEAKLEEDAFNEQPGDAWAVNLARRKGMYVLDFGLVREGRFIPHLIYDTFSALDEDLTEDQATVHLMHRARRIETDMDLPLDAINIYVYRYPYA